MLVQDVTWKNIKYGSKGEMMSAFIVNDNHVDVIVIRVLKLDGLDFKQPSEASTDFESEYGIKL